MPGYLKQSTATQSRSLGPFLDDTDFKTAETALTINNTDIKLVKNGAASVNKNSGGGTHRINGNYSVTFDATDTDTVGELEVSVVVAGALIVFDKWFVLEETVYDLNHLAASTGQVVLQGVTHTSAVIPTVTTTATATNVTTVNGLAANVITAASINAAAFIAAKFGANWLEAGGITAAALNGKGDWTVGNVTLAAATHTGAVIPTVTTLTNLPTIPANWLTAAGLATDAVDEIRDGILPTQNATFDNIPFLFVAATPRSPSSSRSGRTTSPRWPSGSRVTIRRPCWIATARRASSRPIPSRR